MDNILLLSKEVLRPDYLSCYGGTLYETANIDQLAKRGTRFTNFYTASPSSAMAFTAMFTGLYPFETQRKSYRLVERFSQCPTLSDLLEQKGYEIHVVWGGKWFRGSHKRSRVFSAATHFHNLEDIYQLVGPHSAGGGRVEAGSGPDPLKTVYEAIKDIFSHRRDNIFVWLHCPHVFKGRTGYGSDIDLFDRLTGMLFDFFPPEQIYLTGDHGHMNCERGIPVYAFHVYEGAVKVPLIAPGRFGTKVIDDLLSNVQLKNIIVDGKYAKSDFIYSDTQYYLQEDRKLMVRKGDFKYIFNKKSQSEELYDLKFDPHEDVNLLLDRWPDRNRDQYYYLDEIYHYPRWEEAAEAYRELKQEKDRIWKGGRFAEKMLFRLNNLRKKGLANLSRFGVQRKSKIRGRWGSTAQIRRYEK
jgi:arylsulfatase A-like enzyme